ncbi:MAG: hypothetical protein QOI80_1991 [Solirubrobacteraceae bacterium]|nr:hypothetical protein [Solirubrobacteraceae bacterium]
MPLQNRVTPLGELIADPARGLVYGNRGCLHDAHGRIVRFAATQRWIGCRLTFKGWHRAPLRQPGRFTELFFLDEATAFAAGHRPCALCRRADYNRIRDRWGGADVIDQRLERERRDGARRRLHRAGLASLPDGAFVLHDATPHLVHGDALRPWAPAGYGAPVACPRTTTRLITPPSLVELLRDGWSGAVPLLHPSVGNPR